MNESTQRVAELQRAVGAILDQLRAANDGALRSRELSLAITNIEQGQLWLGSLMARLEDTPDD